MVVSVVDDGSLRVMGEVERRGWLLLPTPWLEDKASLLRLEQLLLRELLYADG